MNELVTLVCQWKIHTMYIFRCPVCGWPMCNSKCAKASVHRYWIGVAYHRLSFTNPFTSSLLTGNVYASGLLWQSSNGNIVFRDQECRMYKEKGRKVDCSDWDFEEPQVRIVECTVCKKEIIVVLSLFYCKKRLLNLNLIDSM